MKKYKTTGLNSVKSENMSEAAEIFAIRMARKKYGSAGYCRTVSNEGYSVDGTYGEFSAFIGYKTGPSETTGHNVRFSVYEI